MKLIIRALVASLVLLITANVSLAGEKPNNATSGAGSTTPAGTGTEANLKNLNAKETPPHQSNRATRKKGSKVKNTTGGGLMSSGIGEDKTAKDNAKTTTGE